MISKISAFLLSRSNQNRVILMAIFYCIISYQFFINIDGFNPFYSKTFPITHRYIGFGIISINLFSSLVFVYIQKFDWSTKLKSIFQINLISIFTFLYYAINTKQYLFTFYNIRVDSGIIILPLIALIFFTVKNTLDQNTNNYFLQPLKILLIYLCIFSVDSIFSQDFSLFRNINNYWFSILLLIRPEIWTVLGTASISLLTAIWLKITTKKEFLIQFLVYLFLNLQTVYLIKIISLVSFGFWHNSLFMLIFWDTFFYLFKILNKSTISSDLVLRINLSLGYHSVLFLILILISYI
jgi:hypothetical protein